MKNETNNSPCKSAEVLPLSTSTIRFGSGGEWHQVKTDAQPKLTSNLGVAISDNQNSLRLSPVGPTLLEDFLLREKITHFDHERIPERVVHARGTGAHGYFELTHSLHQYSSAKVLTELGYQTPVFARFSTVAGGSGSADTPRDARGFAVKFYTREGNWDLVGNNIPVFFIQDAIKFPDLVHAMKMEPDRGFPQAATAHDTFWDFISLTPEAMNMVLWIMSDRTLPRSLRMMEGFGIHSFKLINADHEASFVKFHWRPKLGMQSTIWDETVKIAGADPDFHRRDLFEAIRDGDFPEWELAVQIFSQEQADQFPFDHLDATKLIPEELVPLQVIGRMVLNRWPDNFFAETEQVAFCPSHLVPGIDFSNDPLLQGRLFSYLDTQLSRLGSSNFQQLPINAAKCPYANHQRDGQMQMMQPKGRVSYEPNTLASDPAREQVHGGFQSMSTEEHGVKGRIRAESFADHYSQARQFYLSQCSYEQAHIASAFVFEFSKVEHPHIRLAMIAHLLHVDEDLAHRVAAGIGLDQLPPATISACKILNLKPSPALQLIANMKDTLQGRTVGLLIAAGSDKRSIDAITQAVIKAGAKLKVLAQKIGKLSLGDDSLCIVDGQLAGSPSVMFDAIVILLSDDGAANLSKDASAIDFTRDAYSHLKAIGLDQGGHTLFNAASLTIDDGVIEIDHLDQFITAAKTRQWNREARVRTLA